MANIVRLPYSNTASNTPSSLGDGVLAINQADGKLYYRNSSGVVTQLATGSGGGLVEYATTASFPATGSAATLYLATDSRRLYSWTGSVYAEVGAVSSSPTDSRWDLFLPSAPTGVSGTVGNTQSVVSWTAPSVLSATPVTDYLVQYSSNGGTTWTTFADSVSSATSATVTGLTNGTAYVFRVAAVNGVGTGSYSSASSAVTPAADAYWSSVKLLLHCDGASNATTFTDSSSSARAVTAYADAKINTTVKKFGSGSCALDGTGDYLDTGAPVSTLLSSTGNFAVEAWVYLTDASATRVVVSSRTNTSVDDVLILGVNTSRQPFFHTNNTAVINGSSALSLNTWAHIALSRSGSTWSLYLDGTRIGTASGSYTLNNAQNVLIGAEARNTGGAASNWQGYLDDIRFTSSDRGYTGATITVPTTTFPDG